MHSNDQTALLPRQRSSADEHEGPTPDAWTDPDEGDSARQARALTTVAWVLPTLCMAAIGMVRLTWSSLSARELDYWAYAVTPWDRASGLLGALDSGTMPYHVALKAWAAVFGSSDLSLRVPSVVAMALAAGLVAATGARLTRPRTGFTAGIVFIVLPGVGRLGQEIGPGAWAVCLVALSTFLLVTVLDRASVWRYLSYAFVTLLLGLVAPVALLVVIGHGVAVVAMRRGVLPAWLLAAVVGATPALALHARYRMPTFQIGLGSASAFLDIVDVAGVLFGTALVAGALVGLSLLSVSLRKPAVIYTSWAVIPVLLLYLMSRVGLGWEASAPAFTLGGWALLGAHALHHAPVFRGVVAGLILAMFCLPGQIDIRQRDGHGLASAELGAIIVGQAKEGDIAVYGPGLKSGQVGRDAVARYVPADVRPRDALALSPPRTDGRILITECPEVEKCLGGALRVWLVRLDRPESPLAGLPAAKADPLTNLYDLDKTWYLQGLYLARFTLKPSGPDQVVVG